MPRLKHSPIARTRPKTAPKRHSIRKVGKSSLAKLKAELDRVFSVYIRTKYPKVCYTCGKAGVLQNGHFIVRKYLGTRWEEDNCRPQCVGCNIFGKGMVADFEEHLIEELGDVRVSEIKQQRKVEMKPTREWYEEQITHYKELVNHYG